MHSKSPAVAALKAAFPHTIPIFAGFLFLGMTYGVYMRTSGFSFWYPMIMSVVIFGGSLGGLLRFNTEGLDFVMTAMFVVIFMDQWLKEKHHFSAWIGLIASVACLLIFGADNFLIPTMICILVALTALRKPVEAKTQEAVK